MVETQLRWFEHVERRLVDFVLWRVDRTEGSQMVEADEDLEKL